MNSTLSYAWHQEKYGKYVTKDYNPSYMNDLTFSQPDVDFKIQVDGSHTLTFGLPRGSGTHPPRLFMSNVLHLE